MISSISTLMALCEKADNDIRACLNTLQVCVYLCTEVIPSDSVGIEYFVACKLSHIPSFLGENIP